MEWTTLAVAGMSLIGTLAGTFGGILVANKLTTYRIEQLEKKVAAEIIDSYGEVMVNALEEDPTVCLVEFGFAVAHGLNQIWLTAHITV